MFFFVSIIVGTKAQNEQPNYFLIVSDTIVEFNSSGGDRILSVRTNAPSWQLSGKFFWCTKARSDTLIELDCKVNLANDRSDEFYVIAGNLSQKVVVIQKALTSLEKGSWKRAINEVMCNVTSKYENGKYKGEIFQKKERDENRIMTFNFRNGLGVYVYVDRDSYWGEFEYGDSQGKGMFIIGKEGEYSLPYCYDCRYYSGNWVSDMKNGTGRCYDKTGKMIYSGIFNNEKPSDKYPQKCDNIFKFECIEYPNMEKYLGETKNGKREGLGILFFENGDAWYGDWKEDKKNGKGINLFYGGGIKSGKWRDNTLIE